ncbi:uncharacterized protein LOC124538581 [Vanessa cardui]|uniref:uncharacterized protein LOC124538581 n=1 Tax=Vanessa cardui TaxID=171605 RepID=UPI001F14354F|nr:uncharacterized protein LOC124538581 [Vanessa cardui]
MSDRKRERHSREKRRSRHGRHRDKSSSNFRRQMDLILERLNVLEGNNVQPSPTSEAVTPQVLSDLHSIQTPRMTKDVEEADAGSSSRTQSVSAITDAETTTTVRIVDAFRSINTLVQFHQMMRPLEIKLLELKVFNLVLRQERGLAEK